MYVLKFLSLEQKILFIFSKKYDLNLDFLYIYSSFSYVRQDMIHFTNTMFQN